MASSSQQYPNSAGSAGYGHSQQQYQQQIRYSTPPIIGAIESIGEPPIYRQNYCYLRMNSFFIFVKW